MAEIVWTETALTDIDSIAEYISKDSFYYASKFVEKIFVAAKKLEKFPEIGKVVPELLKFPYREILFQRYRIIYRIYQDKVYIITVHHSSRLLSNNDEFKFLFE